MPILGQAGNLLTPFGGVAPGLLQANPFTTTTQVRSVTVGGNYWMKLPGMSQARQYYVDPENTNGPSGTKWVRILLPSKTYYTYQETELDAWSNSDTPALIDNFNYFMYSFVNPSTNARTQSWYFAKPADSNFRNLPPTQHGGSGSPLITLITTTRMADNTSYTKYLRTGISSFGGYCDDGRSGEWGQICLKSSGPGTVTGTGGGFSDFPGYHSFAIQWVSNNINNNGYGDTDCSDSAGQYGATKCSSTRNFAVYVG